MRVMETYDYDDIMSLIKNEKTGWIRGCSGQFRFFAFGEIIGLPEITGSYENQLICNEYSKKNPNFAYQHYGPNIVIWDKSVEEYEKHSAPAFREVDICGMGLYAYNRYAENIIQQVPTFRMRESAENILTEFLEFKHKK